MLLTWPVFQLNEKPPGNYIAVYVYREAVSVLPFVNIV